MKGSATLRPSKWSCVRRCCSTRSRSLARRRAKRSRASATDDPMGKKKRQAALLGLGFDAHDGHTRLTRGKNFVLYGGSEETHAKMQETTIKLIEHLDRRGKQLEDASMRELRDFFHEQER